MANIYLGNAETSPVVIKRLKRKYQKDDRIVQMFRDEGRILSELNHPQIVSFHQAGEDEGPFIEMDFIDGQQLNVVCRKGIHQDRFLPTSVAVALMADAASGLAHFHSAKDDEGDLEIVHCDISPTNLLLGKGGKLSIIDFGIAQARFQSTRGRVFPGKLSYMAPEQVNRQKITARTDIFALGVVFYEITVGQRLFRGKAKDVARRITTGEIPRPSERKKDFPPALEELILKMLEVSPEDRFHGGAELAEGIASLPKSLQGSREEVSDYVSLVNEEGSRRRRTTTWSDARPSTTQLEQVLTVGKGDFMDVAADRETVVEQTDIEPRSYEVSAAVFVVLALVVGILVFVLFALA